MSSNPATLLKFPLPLRYASLPTLTPRIFISFLKYNFAIYVNIN